MAGSKTAYLSRKMLDHALGGAAYVPPATLYLVLSTSAFDPAATGSACAEVPAAGYARIAITNDGTAWSAATAAEPSEKHNLADLAYAAATSAWGTPQSAYLADAATLGNLLYGADITNPQVIGVGDTAKIAALAFVFQEA